MKIENWQTNSNVSPAQHYSAVHPRVYSIDIDNYVSWPSPTVGPASETSEASGDSANRGTSPHAGLYRKSKSSATAEGGSLIFCSERPLDGPGLDFVPKLYIGGESQVDPRG